MNIGLLLVECKVDAEEGDELRIVLDDGTVTDVTSGEKFSFPNYPPFISQLIEAGGLVNLVKEGKF